LLRVCAYPYRLTQGYDAVELGWAIASSGGTEFTRHAVQSRIAGTVSYDPTGNATRIDLDGSGKFKIVIGDELDDYLLKAGGTLTGALTLAGAPTLDLHATTKLYVDSLVNSLINKFGTVRVATTANITIATALTNGAAIDGVTLATGDQVLVKDQSTASQNGVYVVGASPARAAQFDTWAEYPGSLIIVEEGTANADTSWLCTANAGGTLGTTAITFAATPPLNAATLAAVINAGTAKTTPVDADKFGFWDSVSGAFRVATWANITTVIASYIASAVLTFTNKTLTNPTITGYSETVYAPSAGTAFTIDWSISTHWVITTSGNCTITLPAAAVGKGGTIDVKYGGTHALTWAGGTSLKYVGGTPPTPKGASGARDKYVVDCIDSSSTDILDAGRDVK
jgi:hypothetical protein